MATIKNRKDCSNVEQFIWDKTNCTNVNELTLEELWGLKKLCGDQIASIEYEKRKDAVDINQYQSISGRQHK